MIHFHALLFAVMTPRLKCNKLHFIEIVLTVSIKWNNLITYWYELGLYRYLRIDFLVQLNKVNKSVIVLVKMRTKNSDNTTVFRATFI